MLMGLSEVSFVQFILFPFWYLLSSQSSIKSKAAELSQSLSHSGSFPSSLQLSMFNLDRQIRVKYRRMKGPAGAELS